MTLLGRTRPRLIDADVSSRSPCPFPGLGLLTIAVAGRRRTLAQGRARRRAAGHAHRHRLRRRSRDALRPRPSGRDAASDVVEVLDERAVPPARRRRSRARGSASTTRAGRAMRSRSRCRRRARDGRRANRSGRRGSVETRRPSAPHRRLRADGAKQAAALRPAAGRIQAAGLDAAELPRSRGVGAATVRSLVQPRLRARARATSSLRDPFGRRRLKRERARLVGRAAPATAADAGADDRTEPTRIGGSRS